MQTGVKQSDPRDEQDISNRHRTNGPPAVLLTLRTALHLQVSEHQFKTHQNSKGV